MDGARVRAAAAADVSVLARIACRSYAQAFAGILTPEDLAARDEASFAARFTAVLGRMRVLEAEGAPAGFALVTDGHIDMFFLDPDTIGRGLGQVLNADLVAAGARSLECFADNGPARRFYERAGWRLAQAYARDYLGREMRFVRYER